MVGALTGILSNTGKKSFWTTGAVIAVLIAVAAIVTYQMQGASYLTLGALAGFLVLKSDRKSEAAAEEAEEFDPFTLVD